MPRENISRRRVRITIDSLDISSGLLSWGVGRDAIGFEAACAVNGEIILAPTITESLDPKLNVRWNPGKPVSIQIENDAGVLVDLPFGGSLFIISSTYSSGQALFGSAPQPEQLSLEVGDKIAYAREPQPPLQIQGIAVGIDTSITALTNLYLQSKGLSLQSIGGDPVPAGTLNFAPIYPARSSPLVDWLHHRLWCQPDGSFGLWQDSQGRIRLFELDAAAPYWKTLTIKDLPGYIPVADQREQLPGKIKASSTFTLYSSRPTSSSYTALAVDSEGTVIGYDRMDWNLSISNEVTLVQKFRRRGSALQGADPEDDLIILVERAETTAFYDAQKRNDRTVSDVFLLEGNVDPEEEGSETLILAQRNTITNDFRYGVITERRSEARKARGLLNLSGTAAELVTEQITIETWDKIGADEWRYYPRTIYNADIQRASQYSGEVPGGGGPGSRPPSPDIRADLWDVEERQLTAEVVVAYQGSSPGRTLEVDYQDFPPTYSALKRVAEIEATLLLGRYHGHEIQLAISDILEEWPPAQLVKVGTNIFLLSGEVLSGGTDRVLASCTGLWLGTDDGVTGLQPGTSFPVNLLSTQAGIAIANQAGTEIRIN
jgi:hypothetical protein